jgi:hypothetical protein
VGSWVSGKQFPDATNDNKLKKNNPSLKQDWGLAPGNV